MGGVGTLVMPVTPNYIASWASHQRRSPKSSEPGTDMFVPIGTPVYAPEAGIIYGYGDSIGPATGRWVGVNFQSGMSFRALHLSRLVKTSGVVRRGELIGYSGATGYGYEDWSHLPSMPAAHVHVTLWPTVVRRFGYDSQGRPYTIDFMNFVGGPAGGGTTPPTPITPTYQEDDIMRITKDTVGTFWFQAVGRPKIGIRGGADLQLLRRFINSRSTIDGADNEQLFNPAEIDIIQSYLAP